MNRVIRYTSLRVCEPADNRSYTFPKNSSSECFKFWHLRRLRHFGEDHQSLVNENYKIQGRCWQMLTNSGPTKDARSDAHIRTRVCMCVGHTGSGHPLSCTSWGRGQYRVVQPSKCSHPKTVQMWSNLMRLEYNTAWPATTLPDRVVIGWLFWSIKETLIKCGVWFGLNWSNYNKLNCFVRRLEKR